MTTGAVLPSAPGDIAGQRLFAVHDIEFTVADVARHARLGSRELAAFSGDAAAVQESFRRARGLLTADQLTSWLAERAITAEQFEEWTAAPTSTGSWTAFVCSGTLDRTASEVAAAAAAACELDAPPTSSAWFDPGGWTDRLAARACTSAAVSATIKANRLGWTTIRATGVVARSRSVAEELRHWVLDDWLELEIAATQAGCTTYPVAGVISELEPAALRARVAGALPGELVGPVEATSVWTVLRIEARTEPDADDQSIVERALNAVRADAIERAVLRHVST